MAFRALHVTSPLMHGPDVLALQAKLKAVGIPPGPQDGQYGPATATAVGIFQNRHGLPTSGVYDQATATELGKVAAVKPPAAAPPSPGVLALHEALKHVGVKESPAGSNLNIFGAWFGVNGVPWCNEFVSYCFEVGAGYTICKGFHGAGCYPKGCSFVPTTEAWLRATGQWVGRTTPEPGDIPIYNWDGGQPDHIGIVEKYLGGGQFAAVEGNTGAGNFSNGGEVLQTQRYLSQVDGFGRVR